MSLDNNNNIIKELIFINNLLCQNLFLNEIIPLVNFNSNAVLSLMNSKDEKPIPKEIFHVIPGNRDIINDSASSSSESSSLFKNIEVNSIKEEENFICKKRSRVKRPRRENQDNMRRKIKRRFFNDALINKLNDKLKSIGSINYFMKFPQNFVGDCNIKRNKEIINMTLLDLFEKNELYVNENEEGLNKYKHNLNVVQSEEIKENEEFKKILGKTFRELYEEYINSDEFKIGEIGRLKKHKMKDDYIKKYVYYSRELIEFFNQ